LVQFIRFRWPNDHPPSPGIVHDLAGQAGLPDTRIALKDHETAAAALGRR
jgi:hypothetical protein